jgi:hypothetical protein
MIEEQINNQEQSGVDGTFNLQYKPANPDRTAIVIPLSSQIKSPDHHLENNLEQVTKQAPYFEKVENVEA